jgi:curved DNA-binding protein CbpA
MNFYEVLGVKRDADGATIRKAYKSLASAHHPDKGGDVERFQEIKHAYETLKRDESRKRYDETGESGMEPSLDQKAVGGLADMFMTIVKANMTKLSRVDVSQLLKEAVAHNLQASYTQDSQIEDVIRSLTDAKGRVKKGNNVFIGCIDQELISTTLAQTENNSRIELLERMTELVEDFEYDFVNHAPKKSNSIADSGLLGWTNA